MSFHRRSWSVVFVFFAGALSQTGCLGEESSPPASSTQPTWDGDDSKVDTANKYNAVARLSVGCSGVLVSPFWILTAAHCFTSTGQSVTATFNWDPGDSSAPTRTHTLATGGPILLRITAPNPADLNHVAQDFALFRLNSRVSSAIARPIHVPLQADVCPGGWDTSTGFTGTAIGFGGAFPNDSPCGPIATLRRYSKHDGYYRFGQVDGSVYNKTYANSPALCSEYSGVAKGDSGGAFIDSTGRLCGVISGMIPPIFMFPEWIFLTSNHMAGVDSQETIDWLSSAESNGRAFMDASGNFDGECPEYLATCTAQGCDDTNSDSDELVDACDPCPFDSDNSADGDGDGIPNCLDSCPADARHSDAPACDEGGDFDCDGICDGVDICPFRPNAQQTNSNDEVEDVWSAGTMGDACEPVPVPRAKAAPATVAESVGFDNSFFGEKHQLLIQDEIRVRSQRSRRERSRKTGTVSAVVPGVPTHFRFCQAATGTEPPCDDSALVNETELHLEVANAASESPSFRYHRVTMEFSATRGAARTLDYDDGDHEWRWSYEADAAFWQQTGIVNVPAKEFSLFVNPGPASGLAGRFWVHAQTDAGTAGNDVGTGTHGPGSLGGTEQLASRYFDLDPEHATRQFWSYPLREWRPLFIWQTLVDPPPYERLGIVASANPGDAEILVAVNGDEGEDVGYLNLDGTAQPLGGHLGESLRRSFLDSSLVWASAAEGAAPTGKKQQHPSAVAVAPDGTAVVQRAWVGSDKIIGDGELGGGGGAGASTASARAGARTGFVPVYARSLGKVFLVGGSDAAGAPVGNVVVSLVTGSPWVALPARVPLAKVLAATYSYRDQSLYVIDEATTRTGIEVRLIRFDAQRGGGGVLARWTASERYRAGFVTDPDGNLLLSLSSERLARHSVVSVDVDTGEVLRLLTGDGVLAAPALRDENGHVTYTSTREGRALGRRYPSLAGARISLPEAWSVR